MSSDDWDDLSPEDGQEVFDEPEDAEPERSGATEEDKYPMTLLKGVLGLVMTAWLGWTGYQHGRLYGSIDRSLPQELRVAYVRTERSFWDTSAALFGSLAGSSERIRIELFAEQASAFYRGDTATVYRSPGCDCFVTMQQVEASGPYHRIGGTVWSWQGPAALALGLYSLLLLIMGGLGVLGALRGLSLRLQLIHEASVGIFAVVAAAALGWGFWLGLAYSTSAGALYSGIDPEKTAGLMVTRVAALPGWVRSELAGEVRAADGRTFWVSLNKKEFLGLRIGDPLHVVLLDGGRTAEIPRIVKGAQPIVRLFGRPFTWHIFIVPLGILLVLFFVALARYQFGEVLEVLWLQKIWREEMERRYAGLDRAYWPDHRR